MHPLIKSRFSGRSYDSSRPVTQEQLRALVEAAHIAPSCYNEQPWSFIICDRNQDPKAYDKTFSTLMEANQKWAQEAPVLIISVAGSKFSRNGKPNRWGQFDTGAAAISMALEAVELGLMAHQMGGFDEKKISELFSIPEEFTPMSVMAIGYPAEDIVQSEKERKPVSQSFFLGAWGRGIG